MLKAVFFDLDGTLLPFNEDAFIKAYVTLLTKFVLTHAEGYTKESFIHMLYTGIEKMYKNDGSKTNEEVFWDNYAEVFSKEHLKDRTKFDEFYETEFIKVTEIMEKTPISRQIIDFCKENNLITVLSTNPFFPRIATQIRMNHVDLKFEDFAFVSTMENFSFCKPNPHYFLKLLEMYSLKPEEVIVFGNNEKEDADCALKVGIKPYLIRSDYYQKNGKLDHYDVINLDEVIDVIKSHMN